MAFRQRWAWLAGSVLAVAACSHAPTISPVGQDNGGRPIAASVPVEKTPQAEAATAQPLPGETAPSVIETPLSVAPAAAPAPPIMVESAQAPARAAAPAATKPAAPVSQDSAAAAVPDENAPHHQRRSLPIDMMTEEGPADFVITAAVKDPKHPFYGVGHTQGLVVNGESGKELIVVRGQGYLFKVDTGVQHDFYLSTSPRGWGAATLADGVRGNFTYNGLVEFTPGPQTPALVYYQCRNHKNMGSMIHVVNKGDEGTVKLGVRPESGDAADAAAAARPAANGGADSPARQRLRFAQMFIDMSPATKRIESGSNGEAKLMLGRARDTLKLAQQLLDKGKDDEALARINDAMQAVTEAGKLVPDDSQQAEQKARYDEHVHAVQTFRDSYQRNYKLMTQKKGKKVQGLDLQDLDGKVAQAQALAAAQKYVEANRLLGELQRTLTTGLASLLEDEVVSYELTFDSPQEQYEYELSRYHSHEELVPLAIEQKQPSQQILDLMNRFVDRAKEIHGLALKEGEKKNYGEAIQMLEGATSHLQRALQTVGVR